MTTLFDTDDNPRIPSASFSLSRTVSGETRAVPLHLSPTPTDVDLTELYHGLGMLKVDPKPQQLVIGEVLAARREDGSPLYREAGVCVPRRAAKTTTIWGELLGRCALRDGYQVVTTAQTGVKARERFMTVQRILSRNNIGEYVIKKGAGAESIEWANGSRLWVVPPEGGAFRGDSADAILLDEAQEHGPEASADILGGALSLMDTVASGTGGQVIVAGTAGSSRAGMLWEQLEQGRRGRGGIVEYAVPEGTSLVLRDERGEPVKDENGDYVLDVEAILACHPGIGTLTTLDIIHDRFHGLDLAKFSREYGGLWPLDVNARAIDPAKWKAGLSKTHPPYPAHFTLAFDVSPDQSSAALCAAWRDADGHAWVEVLRHEGGDSWLPKAIHERTRRFPNLRVGYDNIGPNQAVADTLNRTARPRPKLYAMGTREIVAAAATVSKEITSGTFRHVEDAALDTAADIVTRRNIGDGSWAWGRRRSGDISTLVAASNALKLYDMDARTHVGASSATRIITRRQAS